MRGAPAGKTVEGSKRREEAPEPSRATDRAKRQVMARDPTPYANFIESFPRNVVFGMLDFFPEDATRTASRRPGILGGVLHLAQQTAVPLRHSGGTGNYAW
jgi:hypothetical protein